MVEAPPKFVLATPCRNWLFAPLNRTTGLKFIADVTNVTSADAVFWAWVVMAPESESSSHDCTCVPGPTTTPASARSHSRCIDPARVSAAGLTVATTPSTPAEATAISTDEQRERQSPTSWSTGHGRYVPDGVAAAMSR